LPTMSVSTVTATATVAAGGNVNSLTATCPSGTTIVGGGFLEPDNSGNIIFTRSTPNTSGNSWQVTAKSTESSILGASHQIQSYAVCLKTS
jgi:hypothetical protein